jgi:hypothetical protein
MPSLEDTIALAARAHAGQKNRGGEPYILHVLRVALAVEGEEARLVALLHDLLEDTGVTEGELRAQGYSEAVVDAVLLLTRDPAEPYLDYVERCAGHPLAREVKLADLADNIAVRRRLPPSPEDAERLRLYEAAVARLRA